MNQTQLSQNFLLDALCNIYIARGNYNQMAKLTYVIKQCSICLSEDNDWKHCALTLWQPKPPTIVKADVTLSRKTSIINKVNLNSKIKKYELKKKKKEKKRSMSAKAITSLQNPPQGKISIVTLPIPYISESCIE